MSRVALIPCGSYESREVFEAVGEGFRLLGGVENFAEMGETILLKPNLLAAAAPESCVTTHPSVFRAVAQHLRSLDVHLTWGDSPGFGRSDWVARKAGILEVAEELRVVLADFISGRDVAYPEGRLLKRWFLANGALDADGIVSLSKMKTHGLTRMTGAVKNMFGCVPGMRKGEFHARMDNADRFAQMLVDLNRALPARLHVMDGVIAMEGNGPRSGDPRHMGVILMSADPVALDATACRLMNLDPLLVGTCEYGERFDLGTWSRVEVVGGAVEDFAAEDFAVNRHAGSTTGSARGNVARFMRRWTVPKPVILTERCTACGRCIKACPVAPKAVDWAAGSDKEEGRPPVHDLTRCIRCYCCQEMCPEGAIDIEIPLLGRIIHR
ncbi:MAG: DUF362 domain-containing protein [Coriobacteriia bacterium]|nr:DUF362 domain-containing protein [Coriobacteriia bacterium]